MLHKKIHGKFEHQMSSAEQVCVKANEHGEDVSFQCKALIITSNMEDNQNISNA